MPVLIRIQDDCTPEVAAALDILRKEMKNHNLKRNGKLSEPVPVVDSGVGEGHTRRSPGE